MRTGSKRSCYPTTLDRETRRAIGQLDFRLLDDRTFMADADEPVRDYVYKSFNHDAYLAGQRGAAINVTRLFAPMLGREAGLAGEHALEVMMPNLEAAPWEAVLPLGRTMRRVSPIERFAANLRRERRRIGLSQEALGDACDLHRTEISLLERAGREPRLSTIVRRARALRLAPADLLKGIH